MAVATKHLLLRSMKSPVGDLRLGATERGICLVAFHDSRDVSRDLPLLERHFGRRFADRASNRTPSASTDGADDHLDQLIAELKNYFAGGRTEFIPPLDMVGTPFQLQVWSGLRAIPYGETISYSGLAERIGRPGAQRAVGAANGANRIAIVIPCHRVLNKRGDLHGYGGGLWRKQALLDIERGGKGQEGNSGR